MNITKPNTTQTPNLLFDELLPLMKEAELRVTLAIIRQTFGWHKDEDKISLSQLMVLTGLSRQGVLTGIEEGMKRGTIKRREEGQGHVYSLDVHEVDQSTKLTRTSQRSRPEPVNEVDTQKKEKEKSKKESLPSKDTTPPDTSKVVALWEQEIKTPVPGTVILDRLLLLREEYGEAKLREAFQIAHKRGVTKIEYITGILRNGGANGNGNGQPSSAKRQPRSEYERYTE